LKFELNRREYNCCWARHWKPVHQD
jgi:hypothetical protein